jgi:glycosyltransferase involved in cell wall biosynthesis
MDVSLTDKKIKVLHVRSTIGVYGAEQVLLNVLPVLERYCDITLITLESNLPESAMLRMLLSSLGLEVYGFETKGRIDHEVIGAVKNQLEISEIDVIHTHDYKSLFYIYNTSKEFNIPIIHHVHGALGNTINEKFYALIEKWMMRKVSKILTVSRDQKVSLEKSFFSYPDIKQINNGTVVKLLDKNNTKNNSGALNLIMVARFTEEKNHLMAIDLMEKLKEADVQAVLTLLGDGPLRADIQEIINDRGLTESVNLIGFTRNVCEWLEKSDVLLITSKTEGMPLNMLEGMERGLPVISTSVGEIPKLIKESSCGSTYETLGELVEIAISISNDKPEWERLGGFGRSYVKKKLSVDNQVDALCFEYAGLV